MQKTESATLDILKNLIEKKEFQKAKNILLKQKDMDPVILNYNLAYLNYSKGDFVKARYYIESSIKGGLVSEESLSLKSEILGQLGIELLKNEYSFADNFWLNLKSLDAAVLINLPVLMLLVLLISLKKKLFILSAVLGLIILGQGLLFVNLNKLESVMVKSDTVVFDGPSKIFEQIQIVSKGQKIIYEKKMNGSKWIKIIHPEYLRGWVNNLEKENI